MTDITTAITSAGDAERITAAGDAERIPLAGALADPGVRRVIDALERGGAAVRYVGGCVRDALVGHPPGDVDLATDALPDRVMALLKQAGIKPVPTGIEHGTVTAVADGHPVEVTTLRRDVETDGRRAVVAFGTDWTEDAARRDFTMNAMSADPDGTLHDPFGGAADARAGRVRFVGDARRRIREDVLRLLRYFRFHARYGDDPPDAEALAACTELAPLLPALSGERVRMELLKLLAAAQPSRSWRIMLDRAILAPILPDAVRIDRLERLEALAAMGIEAARDPLLRLAAVLETDGPGALAIAERLRLSNAERDRLSALAAPAEPVALDADERARRRALHRLGPARFVDLLLLRAAETGEPETAGPLPLDAVRAGLDAARNWVPPCFPLTGRDAMAAGLKPGPRLGQVLGAVEAWWEDADYRPDREACLAELGRRVAAGA